MSIANKKFLFRLHKYVGMEFKACELIREGEAKGTINNRIQWCIKQGIVIRVRRVRGSYTIYKCLDFDPEIVYKNAENQFRSKCAANKTLSPWHNKKLALKNKKTWEQGAAILNELKRLHQPFDVESAFDAVSPVVPSVSFNKFKWFLHRFEHYRWLDKSGDGYRVKNEKPMNFYR